MIKYRLYIDGIENPVNIVFVPNEKYKSIEELITTSKLVFLNLKTENKTKILIRVSKIVMIERIE